MAKTDIQNRLHIEELINGFYEKVKRDDAIGFFFNDVAKTNWEAHLPRMYDFWEQIIFQAPTYNGNPMQTHLVLHHHASIKHEHFDRWKKLFEETVDELFEGPVSEFTKQRAFSIAGVIETKIWQTGVDGPIA
jgi:hemoglobin